MFDYIRYLLLLGVLFFVSPLSADKQQPLPIQVSLIQEEETIQPGQPFWVALHVKLEEGGHVYWKNPGEVGIPFQVKWHLPEGFEAGPLNWPFPKKFTTADLVGFGYEKEVILLTLITPARKIKETSLSLKAEVEWLFCSSHTCQPGSAVLTLPLKVRSHLPLPQIEKAHLFIRAREKIPQNSEQIKIQRKQGIVQLQLFKEKIGDLESIKEVYFFPEQQNLIDHSIDPIISELDSHKEHYFVNLKEKETTDKKSKVLKGVLVVQQTKGSENKVYSFDVNSLIEEETQNELVSVIDPSLFSSPSSTKKQQDSSFSPPSSDSSSSFEGGIRMALVFAFLGGLLLNLMPCVLPVLSFKVMSFVKMAGKERSLILKHGLSFTAGVILSFWVLASLMLLLRSYGQAVGWGFQLQEPLFVIVLATLLFIFALNLFGVFEWGLFVSSWAGQTQIDQSKKQAGYVSSFLSGCLATAIATPCTGPFLGSAIGFAVTLPVFQALLVFTFLGLGMSFPYVLLSFFPSFLRFLPKPGAWMETFKQLMGFLLLTTVLWLAWVFSAQTDSFSLICLLAGFLFFSLAAWCYGQGSLPLVSNKKKVLIYLTVTCLAILGIKTILIPKDTWYFAADVSHQEEKGGWETFSPERVAALQAQGIPVFIDFTAKWCLICQTNHVVLESEKVSQHLAEKGVVKMKADWTKKDLVITKELAKLDRNSVPLYLFYGNKDSKNPVILPQILTPEIVISETQKTLNLQTL